MVQGALKIMREKENRYRGEQRGTVGKLYSYTLGHSTFSPSWFQNIHMINYKKVKANVGIGKL